MKLQKISYFRHFVHGWKSPDDMNKFYVTWKQPFGREFDAIPTHFLWLCWFFKYGELTVQTWYIFTNKLSLQSILNPNYSLCKINSNQAWKFSTATRQIFIWNYRFQIFEHWFYHAYDQYSPSNIGSWQKNYQRQKTTKVM